MVVSALTDNRTVRNVQVLAQLIQSGQASELMDRTLDKLVQSEIDTSRTKLRELRRDLTEFEERYGLSSAKFYQSFQKGLTDDWMDYIRESGLRCFK